MLGHGAGPKGPVYMGVLVAGPKPNTVQLTRTCVCNTKQIGVVIPTLSGAKGRDPLFLSTLYTVYTVTEGENGDRMAGQSDMCADEEERVPRLPLPLRSAPGQGPLGMTQLGKAGLSDIPSRNPL